MDRHRGPPDLTPSIRRWFAEAGCRERSFEGECSAVGVAEFVGGPRRLVPDRRLFTFV